MAEFKVTKHNELVETSYKLGSREQFFVLFLIANLSTRDNDFPQYRLPFSRIMKLMNFDGRRRIANVKDLEKMMDNLNTAPIKFVDGDEDVKIAWITELRYNRKTKEVAFTLNPNLKRYLLNLKGFFTNYNIWNVVYLSSQSIRLYELLKRHEYHRERGIIFKVDYLKGLMGIEDKYPEFYEFKRWVLQPAQAELETYTDIRFVYSEYEKEGKRVISLKFEIFENEPKERPETLRLLDHIRLNEMDRPYMLAPENELPTTEKRSVRPKNDDEQLAEIPWARYRAYQFLEEQGVNTSFILDKILSHPKIKYPELMGFEDIYFKTIWQFFKGKSTAKSMAGAFVSWWKNEKFTTDQMHARFLEAVIVGKKKMGAEEFEARKMSATMPRTDFEKLWSEKKQTANTPKAKLRQPQEQSLQQVIAEFSAAAKPEIPGPKAFDLEIFKKEHPDIFQKFWERSAEEYRAFYQEMGVKFDAQSLHGNIESKTKSYCEEWSRKVLAVG